MRRTDRAASLLVILALWLIGLALPPAVHADSGYAALLVVFGEDDFHTECIAMPGDMTAFDLVTASSLGVIIESDDDGQSMCSIDSVGCNYPTDDCFCECGSETCLLWTDWYRDGSQWEVSLSSSERVIPDGGVEAWTWGDGLSEPPIVDFADICPGVTVTEPTERPSSSDYPTAPTSEGVAAGDYPSAATNTPRPTVASRATTTPLAGGSLSYTATPRNQPTPPGTQSTVPLRERTATPRSAVVSITPASASPSLTPVEADASVMSVAPSSGSATPDQVAMLISTSAARARSTALATQRTASRSNRASGWLVVFGIIAVVAVIYALLLRRQREADDREAPPSPDGPDSERHL
ncbi:MAG: hypothetical protein ABFD20_00405 [Anaerolineales bacterium]